MVLNYPHKMGHLHLHHPHLENPHEIPIKSVFFHSPHLA